MSKHRLARPRRRAAIALLAASACAACTVSEPPGAEPSVPEVVDFRGLQQRLEPSSAEKALLVNFWATW